MKKLPCQGNGVNCDKNCAHRRKMEENGSGGANKDTTEAPSDLLAEAAPVLENPEQDKVKPGTAS